jgi:mannose-6-phosphate isomerase-like protein (cupin superfamily)
MAVVGATIENPTTGEAITWIETAATSAGSLLAFDLALRPDAALAAEHRHLSQAEHFRVESGRIGLRLGDQESELGVGENATVPAGVAHRWWPLGDGGAVIRVELRPALDTELFFETFFGLGRDGKTNRKGIPGLLQIAVAYDELGDSCPQVVKPPPAVQRLVLTPLAPLAKLLGRRATYPAYSPERFAGGPASSPGGEDAS